MDISPEQNALDSLRRMADDLTKKDAETEIALKGALMWAWHAVDLLIYIRLQPSRDLFDSWIQDYLTVGNVSLQLELRDAFWQERECLNFLVLLDLFSAVDLPILKPEFYHGWRDRGSRCRGLRNQVAKIVGTSINTVQRQQLLLLLAAYHRLFRIPADVSFDADPIREAFPVLLDFLEMLIDPSLPEVSSLKEIVVRCRQHLKGK